MLMGVLWHAELDDGSIEDIQCGNQCHGAVALVIQRPGPAFVWFEW